MLGGDRPVRHRRHGRRVEPAGEQAAQRHVGNDLPLDDVFQQLGDCPDRPLQISEIVLVLVVVLVLENPPAAKRRVQKTRAFSSLYPILRLKKR